MQSHRDSDAEAFIDSLRVKAERLQREEKSSLTGGRPGETILGEWSSGGVTVRQLPADEHGVLRISIGGGPQTPVPLDYCVFRGERQQCVDLLRRALGAISMEI